MYTITLWIVLLYEPFPSVLLDRMKFCYPPSSIYEYIPVVDDNLLLIPCRRLAS
jgi:hypothetical protein